ncbi:MAG: DUF3105 domain-containing protein, partial [Candidatus Dormibacteraeota bacterium]|nr:DUF3105 domain-containing protein [Candidatus Dormibacteraeota bacterium]
MEHGGVVLLYRCSPDQCQQLAQLAQQIGQALPPVPVTAQPGQPSAEIKFLATPYQDMPQQAVLLSWTHQEDLQDLSANSAKVIAGFYNQFAGQPPAGEPQNP